MIYCAAIASAWRRPVRARVTTLWVMAIMRIWVRARISLSILHNRSTLASSSTQIGAG